VKSYYGLSLLFKNKIVSIIPLEILNSENGRFVESEEVIQAFRNQIK